MGLGAIRRENAVRRYFMLIESAPIQTLSQGNPINSANVTFDRIGEPVSIPAISTNTPHLNLIKATGISAELRIRLRLMHGCSGLAPPSERLALKADPPPASGSAIC